MNRIMKHKQGKTSGLMIASGIGIFLLLAFLVYAVVNQTTVQQDIKDTTLGCPDSTGVLTVNERSASSYGTDPSSPTITCGVDGGAVTTSVTSGTTTFAVGSNVECLVSKSDYIDESFSFTMPCGGKQLDAPLWYSTSDNPSLTWYNDDDNAMTDDVSGGATNQTDLTAGETFTLKLKVQGTSGESSGDGIIVVEFPASTSSNITSATLDGKQPVSMPSVHTLQNAASKSFAFEVSAVEEGQVRELPFQVSLTASKDLTGGVYTDWYSKQYFIDDDKTIRYGVEDSDGTAKYENTLDSDFYIN